MFLIDYGNKKYTKINISGKNISFINHNNILYFIHYIKPFELYTFDVETGDIKKIDVDDDKNDYKYEYRGGTPGYKLNENEYYGFGHRTYIHENIMKHDVFKWIVYFDMEHAKNKNTATYLTEKDVSYKINDEINSENVAQISARNQSANLPKRTNRVVRNEVDEFLRKYKII